MKKILACLLIVVMALPILTACGECKHTGGTATCVTLAVCSKCGESYGELDPDNHEGEQAWIKTAESHVFGYECCQASEQEAVAHDWAFGECPTCSHVCAHEMDEKTKACKFCGYKAASQGLNYVLVGPTNSYKVNSIGTCTDKDIVIPPTYNGLPVTSIASRAFKGCSTIKSVTMPDSITAIGNEAFSGCIILKSLTLPANLESIGTSAFEKCGVLKTVTFQTTDGWSASLVTEDKDGKKTTTTKDITADVLADTTKAATSLKKTYLKYSWTRKVTK